MKTITLVLLAAAGYVVYRKYDSGLWIWQQPSAPPQISGAGAWLVNQLNPNYPLTQQSVGSESDGRALIDKNIKASPLAALHFALYNPSGQLVYEVQP